MATARGDAPRGPDARPDSEDSRHILKHFLSLSVTLPLLALCPARAATWDFAPRLAASETYTDNVFLRPDQFKQDAWVTQVVPGISITATGPQLQFNLNYDPQFTHYSRDLKEDQIFNRGNVAATAELAKQVLFVDVGGVVDQYDVEVSGPITTSNVNITDNRATVWNAHVSPYLRRDFGSDLKGELRYRYSVVRSDQPAATTALPDSTANRGDLLLASGPAFKLLTWKLSYYNEAVKYANGQETGAEAATAEARRLITTTIGLLGGIGYERYDSGTLAPVSEGGSWNVGFEWTPSPLTRLAATGGKRFFGDAYTLDFNHRTRLTTWSVGYTENITNTRTDFVVPPTTSTAAYLDNAFLSQIPDPVARQKAVNDFIARTGIPLNLSAPVNFFTNEQFLQKRWQASTGILGVSNVVVANAFKETRTRLIGDLLVPATGDFGANDTITQTGGSFAWSLRLSARDAWTLGGTYSRNEFFGSGDRVDHVSLVGTALTRKLTPNLSGAVSYRWRQNNSTDAGASYEENSVSVTLKATF